MSVLDNRPPMRFEVVLKNMADSGVTVLAALVNESDAQLVARALGADYVAGAVVVRAVAS